MSNDPANPYRGRFAPSPTGPLHFGSLVAALGSYLEALRHQGEWLVRIEDLDPPREVAGAADDILRTLEAFGFRWHGEVTYQSRHRARYQAALEQLVESGHAYACACSRREIASIAVAGPAGLIYPGTCRTGLGGREPRAWRVRTEGASVRFDDAVQGAVAMELEQAIGDFIIRRADGYFAYHLALAVDDADAGVTHVVRGHDLLACTPPQIHLQRLLSFPTPQYMHLPVVVNDQGQKLSKQTYAPALNPLQVSEQLIAALRFLGQEPPESLSRAAPDEVWTWAVSFWNPDRIPRVAARPHPASHHPKS